MGQFAIPLILRWSLAPEEQAEAVVTITAGAPLPQGSQPRIAVEGYAAGELIGGVAMDVLVPRAALFAMAPRGDADGDGIVGASDALYMVRHLFEGGAAPVAPFDVNADGRVDVGDFFYLVNHLHAGGPAPQ